MEPLVEAGAPGGRAGRRAAAAAVVLAALGGVALLASRAGPATCGPAEESAGGEEHFDGGLEQLVQDEAVAMGDDFAGAVWEPDGSVTFCIAGDEVPESLRDHPKVRVVKVRFSEPRLDAAMDKVVERLNLLLAPDGQPLASGAWPWEASVDTTRNVVAVTVDASQRSRDAAIRAALADELEAGTVVLTYGRVRPVSHDSG